MVKILLRSLVFDSSTSMTDEKVFLVDHLGEGGETYSEETIKRVK